MKQACDWKNETEKQCQVFVHLENGEKNIPHAISKNLKKAARISNSSSRGYIQKNVVSTLL